MKHSESDKIVAILASNAPQHPITEASMEAWFMALEDVPYEAGMLAAREWIRNHKWFPFPSELRRLIAEKVCGLPPVEDAWRMVLDRMRSTYPGHAAPEWDAPQEIRAAVDAMGGMWQIRMSTEGLGDEKRFADIYGAARDRKLREADITSLWHQLQAGSESEPAPISA